MKRYTPLATLLAGLLIGYLIFGKAVESDHDHGSADAETVWTCSMHPSIRQNEPGSCPLCGMDLIPASGSSDSDPTTLSMTEAAVRLADIRTAVVERASVERSIRLPGRIVTPETASTRIVSLISGRIEADHIGYEGRAVKAGDPLVRIWSPEILSAWQELRTDGLSADAVAERLRYWGLDEAQIRRIRESQEPGMMLAEIADLSRLWVEFDAIEQNLSALRIGSAVRFTTPTLPGSTFTARVVFIDPVVDAITRSVRIRADIANPDGLLKPEMRVSGDVATARVSATVIPASAVLWTGPRSLVYVRRPGDEPVFERREVRIGDRAGDRITILSGLDPGETVVANGAFTVDAEFQLSGKPGMLDQTGPVHAHREQGETAHLRPLIPPYLAVKDALVRSDAGAAAASAERLRELLRNEPLRDAGWNRLRDRLISSLDGWARLDIESQRGRFKSLTDLLADAIPKGAVATELYVQFCPMAFGNTGARWLSDKPLIENPYLPETMLGCGDVVGKL